MRISRIIAVIFVLWPTVTALATDPTTPTTAPRFEGYVFLDTEDKPLPIQSDAEIEAFLAEAEIIETSSDLTGVTNPHKLTLKGDGFEAYAVFKYADIKRRKVTENINGRNYFSLNWCDSYRYDIAAYELDRLLGLDRVPPTVSRAIKQDSGAVSIWLAKTVNAADLSRKLKVDPPDQERWIQQRLILQIFSNLVANRDCNKGNLLIDSNWRLSFIDCSRCFGATKTIYYPLEKISQCERGLWQGLKSLNEEEIRESLSPLLDRVAINALLTRRDKLVQHFRKLIDEKGEAAVLYDVDPPSETAPWGND